MGRGPGGLLRMYWTAADTDEEEEEGVLVMDDAGSAVGGSGEGVEEGWGRGGEEAG